MVCVVISEEAPLNLTLIRFLQETKIGAFNMPLV